MRRNFFSLTYADNILRLVKISGKKIDSVAWAEIPAGVVNAGKIDRIKIFAQLIDDLRKNAQPRKITASEVVAAIPEEKVFLKTILIPKMPIDRISSAISWQIESLIPFKQSEIYFNWKIIGSTADKLLVLVSVCERKIIDSFFESLLVAKLKPLIITFPSAGLANLFAQSNQLTLIIDLSRKDNISLIVAKDRSVHFSISRHISSNLKGLKQIIHDTIVYYHQKYSQEEIANISIFGPAHLPQIEEKIQQSVSKKTKIGTFQDITVIRNIKEEYLPYIDNLGLDLALDKFNLLPPDVRENAKNESANYQLSSISNYFILFMIIIALAYALFWIKIHYDVLKVNKDYANLLQSQTTSQQEQLENKINKFNEKIAIIKSLSLNQSIKPSFMEKIISVKDENITLKEIAVEANKNIKIKGIAKGRNDLIIYKDKLNQLDIMAPIELPITALEKKENVEFELTSVQK